MTKQKMCRIISIFLVLLLIGGSVTALLTMAEEVCTDPSIILLESMLNGDRSWVLDTIVNDDRSSNPYANAYSTVKTSLMETALSQIENSDDPNYRKSYTILVNVLTKYYYENTWDDDLAAGILDLVDEVLELFGSGENAFGSFFDDLKKTAEEEKFEAILQSVFTDTYTASWGETVNQQETSLLQLSEIADSLENYKALTDYWAALYGVALDEESETIIDYQKNVINPLISSGQKYLSAFSKLSEGEQAAASVAITGASALAMWNWHTSYSTTYTGVPTLTHDLLDYVAGKDAADLVKTVGNTFSFASSAINQFTYLHAMCQQRSIFHDTLLRVSAQADGDGQNRMRDVLRDYADQMDDVLEYNKLNYHIFVSQLAKTSTIQKNLKYSKALEAAMPDAWKKAYSSCDLASMTQVFDAGMFGIDLATNLKGSCIKISEMKYLRTMINEAKKVYEADLLRYTGDPTPYNAEKVLNDLLFLQRLRLRGENLAYKMVKGQLNSGIARLISGSNLFSQGDTVEAAAWTERYQRSIDCLIGASINPISYMPFEVNSGDQLVIYYDKNAKSYCGGYSDGTVLYEMQYRIMNGIKLNGGTLSVMEIAIPFIEVANGGTLSIDASTATIGELTQSGRMTLNVYQDDLDFQACLDLSNAVVNLNGNTISSPDLTLSNSVSFRDGLVQTDALHLKSAAVTGSTIQCSGNVDTSGSCVLDSLELVGANLQQFTGSFTAAELLLHKTGFHRIGSTGTITVTGSLDDPKDQVSGGLVLTDTAGISGTAVASDLTLKGTTITTPVEYQRNVTVSGGASLNGGRIRGALRINSGTLTNKGPDLRIDNGITSVGTALRADARITAHGDSYFSSTDFSGPGGVHLYGVVNFTSGNTSSADTLICLYGNCTSSSSKDTNHLTNLNLCGSAGQTIGFTGTVENLELSNTSAIGIQMTGSTYVSKLLTARNQRISLGNHIILTGDAAAELDNVSGSLQIQDWHGTGLDDLNGTLYASGSNTLSNDMEFGGGLRHTGGTITLRGASVTFGETVESTGAWNIDSGSTLTLCSDAALTGSVQNQGCLSARHLNLSATVSGDGEYAISGNLNSGKAHTMATLRLCGATAQRVQGTGLTAGNVILENSSFGGITFDSTVTVTDSLTALNQKLLSGDRLILTGKAGAALENVSGSLRIENWSGDSLTGLRGTLYASGSNVISSDLTLRGGLRQTGGSIRIEGASLTCQEGLECAGAVTVSEGSTVIAAGDSIFQGAVVNEGVMQLTNATFNAVLSGGGSLECRGDLQIAKSSSIGPLLLTGRRKQTVSGSSLTVTDLSAANTSGQGITLNNQIYVTGAYSKNCTLYGTQPVQLLDSAVFDRDTEIAGLNTAGDVLVGENVTLTVRGDAVVSGSVILSPGAKLIIHGNLLGSSPTIQVGEGAGIDVRRNLRLTSGSLTLDGTLTVWHDAILSGGSVSGGGSLVLLGDLENSAAISDLNRFCISGRVPQSIRGSAIHAARVKADNPSTGGVTLGTTIYYSESLTISEGCNINQDNIKEE